MLEFSRWAPKLRVMRFHTNDVDERRRLRQEVGRASLFGHRPRAIAIARY